MPSKIDRSPAVVNGVCGDAHPDPPGLRLIRDGGPIPPADQAAAVACVRLALGHRIAERTRRTITKALDWSALWASLLQTEPAERADWIDQWCQYERTRRTNGERLVHALNAARLYVVDHPDDPEPDKAIEQARPFTSGIVGSREFGARTFPREWLIRHILTLGQPTIIGGPRKALKTTTCVDLAISIATATRFLGEFDVPRPRRVLFLSGESGDATIQETARRVCKARDLDFDDLEGRIFWGFKLPQLSDQGDMDELASYIRDHEIEVVIVDPLYLCLLSGNSKLDPANLFDVGPLLARITATCLEAGATPLLVHHLRKNRDNPDSPPELEDLAFAGVQEFARQWILIGRREAYEPGTGDHKLWLNVGGSAGHSGSWALNVAEGIVDDDFSGRDWNVSILRASEARATVAEQAAAAKAEKMAEAAKVADQARRRKVCDDAETAFLWLKKNGPASKSDWRNSVGFNAERIGSVIAELLEQKRIRHTQFQGRTGRGTGTIPGYEIGDPDEGRTRSDKVGQTPDCPTLDSSDGKVGQTGAPPLSKREGSRCPSDLPDGSKAKRERRSKVGRNSKIRPTLDAEGSGGVA